MWIIWIIHTNIQQQTFVLNTMLHHVGMLWINKIHEKLQYDMKKIVQIGWQVVPGITCLFLRNYMEMCSRDLLEMQELTDTILWVLLIHIKIASIILWWWQQQWGFSTTIKFNNKKIGFARCNHIFHRFSAKSLITNVLEGCNMYILNIIVLSENPSWTS